MFWGRCNPLKFNVYKTSVHAIVMFKIVVHNSPHEYEITMLVCMSLLTSRYSAMFYVGNSELILKISKAGPASLDRAHQYQLGSRQGGRIFEI